MCVCVCVCVCVEWGGRQVAWIQDYVDLLHCPRLHSVAAGIVRACAGNKIIFYSKIAKAGGRAVVRRRRRSRMRRQLKNIRTREAIGVSDRREAIEVS